MDRLDLINQLRFMRDYSCEGEAEVNALCEAITALSAEPQIIRCKDCKHRDPEDKKCDCGHDIRWQLPRRDDWYCADAERRTDG